MEILLGGALFVSLGAVGYFYLKSQKIPSPPVDETASRPEPVEAEAKPGLSVPQAESRAKEILVEAKEQVLQIKSEAEEEARRVRQEIFELERRLATKEEGLDRRQEGINKRQTGLDARERDLEKKKQKVSQLEKEEMVKLEEIASLSRQEAQTEYFKKLEKELADEAARRIKEAEEYITEEADQKAREILLSTLQRVAVDHVAATTTAQASLSSDDMKGRIIGREGRNIKAFETAAAVQVEIDDEPGVVRISSFDPVRREVARLALEKLIADGRIQPARIEEVVEKTRQEVAGVVTRAGEEHAHQAGVTDLPRELLSLLGRFKFRTSYGQNMLEHNLEVVQIGVLLAKELGARAEVVRKACLLHDIGKAVSGEVEGGHAEVGAEIARRYGVSEEVVQAFEFHHADNLPSPEAIVVYLADAISAARPAARREDYEAYIQRVQELENIAGGFIGVEKAYAISAGREVRVIVRPQDVSDSQMVKLAHDIARKVHEQIQNFPGQIKVNVIRETRATEYVRPNTP